MENEALDRKGVLLSEELIEFGFLPDVRTFSYIEASIISWVHCPCLKQFVLARHCIIAPYFPTLPLSFNYSFLFHFTSSYPPFPVLWFLSPVNFPAFLPKSPLFFLFLLSTHFPRLCQFDPYPLIFLLLILQGTLFLDCVGVLCVLNYKELIQRVFAR